MFTNILSSFKQHQISWLFVQAQNFIEPLKIIVTGHQLLHDSSANSVSILALETQFALASTSEKESQWINEFFILTLLFCLLSIILFIITCRYSSYFHYKSNSYFLLSNLFSSFIWLIQMRFIIYLMQVFTKRSNKRFNVEDKNNKILIIRKIQTMLFSVFKIYKTKMLQICSFVLKRETASLSRFKKIYILYIKHSQFKINKECFCLNFLYEEVSLLYNWCTWLLL